ncbi:sigma factor G inhibitor Gin [Jeotgalibacillus proteolyticus]|uniref:sigma factor G inhibitor Gin n=1 Tax=Jeotgalibacillus TaxID=157226 RepID=UPI003CEFEFAF
MRVCQACRRRYKRGIQLQNKLICSWCEQSLIKMDTDDQTYDRWVYILRRDTQA